MSEKNRRIRDPRQAFSELKTTSNGVAPNCDLPKETSRQHTKRPEESKDLQNLKKIHKLEEEIQQIKNVAKSKKPKLSGCVKKKIKRLQREILDILK